jgi:hypothetical protein
MLSQGNYAKDVINYMGITEFCYYNWVKLSKEIAKDLRKKTKVWKELTLYQKLLYKFYKSVKKADAVGKMRHIQNIQKAAIGTDNKYDEDGNLISEGMKPQWTASAWFLERRDYKQWGRKDYQKIDANVSNKDRLDPKDKQELITEIKDLIDKDV